MKYKSEFVKGSLKESRDLPDFNVVDVKSVLARLKPVGDSVIGFVDRVGLVKDDGRIISFQGRDANININRDYISKVVNSGRYIDVFCKSGLYYAIELK